MIIECPHCFTKVIPKIDDSCPSCRKNVNIRSSNSINYQLLNVSERNRFPDICFKCGMRTTVRRTFRNSKTNWMTDFERVFYAFLSYLIFRNVLLVSKSGTTYKTRIDIPICNECYSKNKNIDPEYFNPEEGQISYIVHKKFKDSYEELNNIESK